ncbi:MAG: glycoside hydrolase family 38 C-terminal domain-containing protein [Niameybacter sp.]|uniref:glycoside hydrolase family 38 N-terminal domain-containing protein n=1 Tax=Niameybacter sp. TaxID=2033640 RepID=UPI002FCA7828
MNSYNKLMSYRDDFEGNYWNQMVEVNNPKRETKNAYWEERIFSELRVAMELALTKNKDNYKEQLEHASHILLKKKKENGYITKEDVIEVEGSLTHIGKELREYTVHCVGHAHIDMNWLWGWHETVSVIIDTFKTMLQLLKEYKDFTYSQSQASTYKIIEEYCPEMIEEIKKYVHEGRWELAASTWVENDRNMSNGESFARHILYTKDYLSKLFDIDVDMLQLDFEPDCFGHSAHIPEILKNGGVKYYYHCRGLDEQTLYKWQAPSGASVLSYREPIWYGNSITGNALIHVPKICEDLGLKDSLFVYGVGDHGGGPTRRDIEKMKDMNYWPIYPTVKFSTYHDYFKTVEPFEKNLPVVDHELNFTLTGCFTSSSRIKMANRYSENTLADTEYVNALSHVLLDRPYQKDALTKSWHKTLFNQFHDVLPGCGINFTREYALGEFQNIMAKANTIRKAELEYIVSHIDTQGIEGGEKHLGETAEGAGVGNHPARMIGNTGVSFNLGLAQTARYGGETRLYTLFNHTAYEATRYVELLIWDYRSDVDELEIFNSKNELLRFEKLGQDYNQYWGHWYTKVLLEVKLPSYGYDTIRVTQNSSISRQSALVEDRRTNEYLDYVLENEYVKATFDVDTLVLKSLYNKEEQVEYLTEEGADFNYIKEDATEANAWIVGNYVSINQVKKEVTKIKMSKGEVAQSLSYVLEIGVSRLQVTVSLEREAKNVKYHVEAVWNEIGDEKYVPQLNYKVNIKMHTGEFIYDVPMGSIKRGILKDDVPAIYYGMAYCEENQGIYIASDSKYGYRGLENSLALSLLRSTQNPDTHPETGTHVFEFRLGYGTVEEAQKTGILLNHAVDVINCKPAQIGTLPQSQSFFSIKGEGVVISAIKRTESDEKAWIVRFYETSGQSNFVSVVCPEHVVEAHEVDFLERKIEAEAMRIESNKITVKTKPYQIKSLKVRF